MFKLYAISRKELIQTNIEQTQEVKIKILYINELVHEIINTR